MHRLSRDEWWRSIRGALDGLAEADTAAYQEESRRLEAAAADGLDDR